MTDLHHLVCGSVCLVALACGETTTSGAEAPWSTQSAALEMQCGGFFEGAMRFRATRDELSERELTLLASLKTTKGAADCPEDISGCRVKITDDAGGVADYVATAEDYCGGETTQIAYDSLSPLLSTIGCKYAKESVDVLEPDPRCLHGMFAYSGGSTIHQSITVPDATATHQIALLYCDGTDRLPNVSMTLTASDGTMVAVGAPVEDPGTDRVCMQMSFSNVSRGELVITTTTAYTPQGDFFLRFK